MANTIEKNQAETSSIGPGFLPMRVSSAHFSFVKGFLLF